MTRLASLAATMATLLALAPALRAETSAVSATGFTSSFSLEVDSDPDKVWTAFTQLPRWWSGMHTWSGQAANLSLDAQAGGCWCERWGEGQSVQHARVVLAQPGSVLRLHGSLGPLQDLPVQGVLTFATARRDGATRLRVSYRVGGPPDAGLEKLAPLVDRVIGEQVARLKTYIETGRAP